MKASLQKSSKNRPLFVSFHKPVVTSVKVRPCTEPSQISQMYYTDEQCEEFRNKWRKKIERRRRKSPRRVIFDLSATQTQTIRRYSEEELPKLFYTQEEYDKFLITSYIEELKMTEKDNPDLVKEQIRLFLEIYPEEADEYLTDDSESKCMEFSGRSPPLVHLNDKERSHEEKFSAEKANSVQLTKRKPRISAKAA